MSPSVDDVPPAINITGSTIENARNSKLYPLKKYPTYFNPQNPFTKTLQKVKVSKLKVNVPIRTHHQDDILSETEVASSEKKKLETPNYVIRVVVLLTPH